MTQTMTQERDLYTRSDGWGTVDNGGDAIRSEEEALALVRELQGDPEMDGWYATRPVDERYGTTIVEPADDVTGKEK